MAHNRLEVPTGVVVFLIMCEMHMYACVNMFCILRLSN